jgi:hypothetical protein
MSCAIMCSAIQISKFPEAIFCFIFLLLTVRSDLSSLEIRVWNFIFKMKSETWKWLRDYRMTEECIKATFSLSPPHNNEVTKLEQSTKFSLSIDHWSSVCMKCVCSLRPTWGTWLPIHKSIWESIHSSGNEIKNSIYHRVK